jgi:hypothetical protein
VSVDLVICSLTLFNTVCVSFIVEICSLFDRLEFLHTPTDKPLHLQMGRTELEFINLGLDVLVRMKEGCKSGAIGLDFGLLELHELLGTEILQVLLTKGYSLQLGP